MPLTATIPTEKGADASSVDRVSEEIRDLAAEHHPSVQLMTYDRENGQVWLKVIKASEYAQLAERLRNMYPSCTVQWQPDTNA